MHVADLRNKIRELKIQLQNLNNMFKSTVENTKLQNQENHKIHDQNKLVNRLKSKIGKKSKKTTNENKSHKLVLGKLETFGYGYQKTFKDKAKGNLKRQVSLGKPGRSKSLIRDKHNLAVGYSVVEGMDKENLIPSLSKQKSSVSKKNPLKKYKSASRPRTVSKKPSKMEKRKSSNKLKKSKSNI
jgi:hypothetical protein